MLNDSPDQNGAKADDYCRRRISWTLGLLVQYAEALAGVRAGGNIHHQDFPFGM